MLFLARWQIDSDVRARVLDLFTRTGGTPPPGVRIVGRWHRADGTGGIMIVESDSMAPITEFAHEWNDLLFVEITPVIEDHDLRSLVSRLASRTRTSETEEA
jgi:hypothetical protein